MTEQEVQEYNRLRDEYDRLIVRNRELAEQIDYAVTNSDGNIVKVITYFKPFLSVCKKNGWINKEIQIVFPSNDLLFTTNA